MARLEKTSKDIKALTIKDYIDIYHGGRLTVPAICYAIKTDKVDYIQPQRERFIVITKKTLSYKPRIDKIRKK